MEKACYRLSIIVFMTFLSGPLEAVPREANNTEKKSKAFSPERFRPDAEVPINPDRYLWKVSTKRSTLAKNSNEVPVYFFGSAFDKPSTVGSLKVGEPIVLEEFRLYGRRHFYRYPWKKNATNSVASSRSATFWIDGMNIDYAGTK